MSVFPKQSLKLPKHIVKIGKHYFMSNSKLGVYPVFSLELNRRVKNKEACNIVVCGEAGTSKSYTGEEIGLNIDPRFCIDDIVFTYSQYCKRLAMEATGLPIMFDEPSYAMGKREWYKQVNQALTKTIESQRFLVRPLIIPIINQNLLDKTLRGYLIQFQVTMTKRGRALVHRIRASQNEDKVYRYLFCRLRYLILDHDDCDKETCLGCKQMKDCNLLRAQYERKKREIQLSRYAQDAMLAEAHEAQELTNDQICEIAFEFRNQFIVMDKSNIRKVDVIKLKAILQEERDLKLAHSRAYEIRALLLMKYPNILNV